MKKLFTITAFLLFFASLSVVHAANPEVLSLKIEPASISLDIGQTYNFEAYAVTSTGPVAINSMWNVEGDVSLVVDDCEKKSKVCQIYVNSGPGTLKISADAEDHIAYSTVTITDKLWSDSSEAGSQSGNSGSQASSSNSTTAKEANFDPYLVILQESRTMTLGSKFSFSSYMNYSTGVMPVKASWSLSDEDLADLDPACVDSSRCTVYAGLETGQILLHAETEDGYAAQSQIKIVNELTNPFTDDLPQWAAKQIISLHSRGIITGYEDGSYGAEDPVTRGQLVLLLQRLLKHLVLYNSGVLNAVNCNKFNDVPREHYAYEALCYGDQSDWLDRESSVYDDFQPDIATLREVSAYNVFKAVLDELLVNLDLEESVIRSYGYEFEDVSASYPYLMAIGAVNFYEIMTGQEDGRFFTPKGPLNRAEAAVVLYRILDLLN